MVCLAKCMVVFRIESGSLVMLMLYGDGYEANGARTTTLKLVWRILVSWLLNHASSI